MRWTLADIEKLKAKGLGTDGEKPAVVFKQPTIRKNHESELQQECVRWFRLAYTNFSLRLFAIPNGGKRNAREAKRFQLEGVVPGVADLFLAVPKNEFHGLFIEMKVGYNKQSEHQIAFMQAVEKEYCYVVCRSFQEFESIINKWFSHDT